MVVDVKATGGAILAKRPLRRAEVVAATGVRLRSIAWSRELIAGPAGRSRARVSGNGQTGCAMSKS
jgi:hypothetical protein